MTPDNQIGRRPERKPLIQGEAVRVAWGDEGEKIGRALLKAHSSATDLYKEISNEGYQPQRGTNIRALIGRTVEYSGRYDAYLTFLMPTSAYGNYNYIDKKLPREIKFININSFKEARAPGIFLTPVFAGQKIPFDAQDAFEKFKGFLRTGNLEANIQEKTSDNPGEAPSWHEAPYLLHLHLPPLLEKESKKEPESKLPPYLKVIKEYLGKGTTFEKLKGWKWKITGNGKEIMCHITDELREKERIVVIAIDNENDDLHPWCTSFVFEETKYGKAPFKRLGCFLDPEKIHHEKTLVIERPEGNNMPLNVGIAVLGTEQMPLVVSKSDTYPSLNALDVSSKNGLAFRETYKISGLTEGEPIQPYIILKTGGLHSKGKLDNTWDGFALSSGAEIWIRKIYPEEVRISLDKADLGRFGYIKSIEMTLPIDLTEGWAVRNAIWDPKGFRDRFRVEQSS
ncbi:MAG: hypothetical protein V1858_04690 [Candidatus Gottesmanbacteria bacterium]